MRLFIAALACLISVSVFGQNRSEEIFVEGINIGRYINYEETKELSLSAIKKFEIHNGFIFKQFASLPKSKSIPVKLQNGNLLTIYIPTKSTIPRLEGQHIELYNNDFIQTWNKRDKIYKSILTAYISTYFGTIADTNYFLKGDLDRLFFPIFVTIIAIPASFLISVPYLIHKGKINRYLRRVLHKS